MKRVPLTYPLPQRNWFQLPNGKWGSKAWTEKEKAAAEAHRYKLVR